MGFEKISAAGLRSFTWDAIRYPDRDYLYDICTGRDVIRRKGSKSGDGEIAGVSALPARRCYWL